MSKSSYTAFIITGMLITGACNTLLNKLQDKQCVKNCDTSKPEYYEQPVWQTFNMFMGETLCLLASLSIQYYSKKKYIKLGSDVAISEDNNTAENSNLLANQENSYQNEGNSSNNNSNNNNNTHISESVNKIVLTGKMKFLLWCPSIFDICGTTLMNVGLIYVAASVYQMLRGAVVIFTGIFSVIFLKKKLSSSQWVALLLVVTGITIVGLSNVTGGGDDTSKNEGENGLSISSFSATQLLGVGMVLLAQIFTALQFIVEEKIMSRYEISPLETVGLEGIFGLSTVFVGMFVLHGLIGMSHPGGYFDIPSGFKQSVGIPSVLACSIGCILSIAFFNYFGLSVTNVISATSRSTIDTCRTILIWAVSLYLGWEIFSWLQVLGFLILIYGTFLFNGVVNISFLNSQVNLNNTNSTLNEPGTPNERKSLLDHDHHEEFQPSL